MTNELKTYKTYTAKREAFKERAIIAAVPAHGQPGDVVELIKYAEALTEAVYPNLPEPVAEEAPKKEEEKPTLPAEARVVTESELPSTAAKEAS